MLNLHISLITDLDMLKQELTKFLLTFQNNPSADGCMVPNDNSLIKWCENRGPSARAVAELMTQFLIYSAKQRQVRM